MKTQKEIFLFFLIILTGCVTPDIKKPTQTNVSIPERTSTVTPTMPIVSTLSWTPTQFPSSTPTMNSLPTITPLPTLEPTTALLFVENLLQNNAGCRLPCWWGITPGKTTWLQAKQFLDSFSLLLGITGNPNDNAYASFRIPYPENMGSISHGYGIKDGIVEEIIDLYNGNITTNYNLVEILNTYGKPDNILISAYYEPRHSDYMVEIAVFYLQQGILVIYYDNDGRTLENKIEACPQKAAYPYLNLWSPALNMSLQDAISHYLDTLNWPPYRTLQESTGMSVETFYQTFKDANNNSCVELNAADWPEF